MTNINKLLTKYEKPVKGERYTRKYKQQLYYESKKKHRHLLLDKLLNETPFQLTDNEITRIRFFINTFNNEFKDFHRQSKDETIILAFIFLMRTLTKPKTNIDEYSISTKYKLNNTKFRLIICRLNDKLMMTTPLTYQQIKKDKHETLIKSGY